MEIVVKLSPKEKAKLKSVKNNILSVIEEVEKVINAIRKCLPKVTVK